MSDDDPELHSEPEEALYRIISARPAALHEREPMSKVPFHRKRGALFRFSDRERKRLKELSDAELDANAQADAENPSVDEARLSRMALAREVRLIREKTGLSQPQFAARFHLGLARLRDYEQARSEPDIPIRVFLRLIQEDPAHARRLVEAVERQTRGYAVP